MKYVCRQINPEYQESPMYLNGMEDDVIYAGLFLVPVRGCVGIREKELENIRQNMEDVISEYEDIQNCGYSIYYKNFTEVVNDIFPRKDGKHYNSKQIHEWKEIAENFDEDSEDYARICSLVTGAKWEYKNIRGCCQGDYAEVIYNTEMWTDKAIECIETEYFNTGSEWMCDYSGIEDTEKITANCVDNSYDTVSVYTYSWDDDDIRQELADSIGCDVNDVVMFEYKGSHSVADYERV